MCVGGGMLWAAYYTLRLATRNPDVSWRRKVGFLDDFFFFDEFSRLTATLFPRFTGQPRAMGRISQQTIQSEF